MAKPAKSSFVADRPIPPPHGTNQDIKVRSKCSDSDVANKPLIQKINWLSLYLVVGIPVVGFSALFWLPLRLPTFILGFVTYCIFGIGITAGYHRLLSHRSFDAVPVIKFILVMLGSAAFEGSARWWARNHRAHHRYVDTNKDPYNATRGFWYSHMGWMLIKQNPNDIGRVDISDLNADPLLRWQHRNYLKIAIVTGIVIPTLIASLWGDALGGFFYASLCRIALLHQATFCINSLAHWWGDKEFSEDHTACDYNLTGLITFGEGYHNFHHTFASDYRNGVKWYHWDPAKWMIKALSWVGLTYNLNAFPDSIIKKTMYELQLRKIKEKIAAVDSVFEKEKRLTGNYPLKHITMDQVRERANNGEDLLVIEDKVYRVDEKWYNIHPGGRGIIKSYIGKDATTAFNGMVHPHSYTARNVLSTMVIGYVTDKKPEDMVIGDHLEKNIAC
eukprot:GEZU01014644.1.p1 GENE.GEZU01014644.1~~GEZU01014644.1.p1  ORF type:complete len:446 (+),score=134.54 GEZU01014644.1:88-1425(+)